MQSKDPNRRGFLQAGVAGLATTSMVNVLRAQGQNEGGVPTRPLGKTGVMVSLLGLGGHASTNPQKLSESESLKLIQRAVDEGITMLDNAWDYHDGLAEERMGKALSQGKLRDKVFLMTKCCGRTAKDAQSNLEDSLRRLKTDHLDLWQFHEICYDNDPEWIFAAEGAYHTARKALEQGKIRFLGFTGHKDPAIHLKMLEKPAEWHTVQMPLNVMDAHYRSFQHQVLPELLRRGIGTIGMKSLGGSGNIVTSGGVSVENAIGYVLSLPISTLISGIDSMKVLEQNLKIVRAFQPFDAARRAELEHSVALVAGDGRYELFKSSKMYDGPVHRKQHGFDTQLPA